MINGIKTINGYDDIVWKHPKTGYDHRLDGPAFIAKSGYRRYSINRKWHNINGPARILNPSNKDNKEYYIDGRCYKSFSGVVNRKHKWLLISLKRKLIQKKKY